MGALLMHGMQLGAGWNGTFAEPCSAWCACLRMASGSHGPTQGCGCGWVGGWGARGVWGVTRAATHGLTMPMPPRLLRRPHTPSPGCPPPCRYLERKDDEQARGITMKSSSISLLFVPVAATRPQCPNSVSHDERLEKGERGSRGCGVGQTGGAQGVATHSGLPLRGRRQRQQ